VIANNIKRNKKMSTTFAPPKLLAPAGGRSQFFAALQAGADGVYLGLKTMSARASAENFTLEDLEELTPLAQKYGMEVLVAVNTVLEQREMESLPPVLAALCDIGVSGLIVQDLGVAHLVHTQFNSLPLHASTQMAIHNIEGVRAAKNLGFKRVVLSRELTLSEISDIRSEFSSHDMELEIFCHGSLCYAYSGLCLFGGIHDGRSGNKGACPYPCRRLYKNNNKQTHAMSMRDLNTLEILPEIVRAKPDVLKIEGRKKDAQYVTAIVQSYRSKLNAIFGTNTLRKNAPEMVIPPENILAEERAYSFQRSTTTLFLENKQQRDAITLDPLATTHLGLPIGTVSNIDPSGITFQTNGCLTLHDGLLVETVDDSFAFGVSKIYVNGKSVTSASAGSIVSVCAVLPRVPLGARVFKTRSDTLRSRVEAFTRPPNDERLRPILPFHLLVEVQFQNTESFEGAVLKLIAQKHGETVLEKLFPVEASLPLENNADWQEKLTRSVTQTFSLFGDFNRSATVQLVLPTRPIFIPPSLFKKVKREFGVELSRAFPLWREHITNRATLLLAPSSSTTTPATPMQDVAVRVKTDIFSVAQALPPENTTFAMNSRFLNADLPQTALSPKTRIALPLITRAPEMPKLRARVQWFLQNGHQSFEVGGLGSLQVLKECAATAFSQLEIIADASLYARNTMAIKQLSQMGFSRFTLSHEETLQNLSSKFFQGTLPFEVVALSNLALMYSENCVKKSLQGHCGGTQCDSQPIALTDSQGRTFLAYRDGCRTIMTAQEDFSLLSKWSHYKTLGAAEMRAEILWKDHTQQDAIALLNKLSEFKLS
jgi:putative protease